MKKFIILVVLILFVAVIPVFGQDNYNFDLNGDDWVEFPFEWKVGYVTGITTVYNIVTYQEIYWNLSTLRYWRQSGNLNEEQAQLLLELLADHSQKASEKYSLPLHLTYGKLVKRIDQAYEHYENRHIPIIEMVLMVYGKEHRNIPQYEKLWKDIIQLSKELDIDLGY